MQRHPEAEWADVVALRLINAVRIGLCTLLLCAGTGLAAPYAAMVMDARTGKILHSRNADTKLHPASLTKMMTLYVAFEAIRNGEITLDTKVKISRNAAAEPPSKLGLKAGQRIALRYLIRASAVKSANDAATAIGEAISGSEAKFTRRMNKTAKALGMKNTSFKNAHGLTQKGHMSTATDMTILGRHMIYDYPQYYNLFSRQTTHAGVKQVRNTNRRLLNAYRGADGIKTGYTRAAGFNLVASAERGRKRVIATVFGGRSTASRNARVAELLDMGFQRAASRAKLKKPAMPNYEPVKPKTIAITAVRKSLRPTPRPLNDAALASVLQEVDSKVTEARALVAQQSDPPTQPSSQVPKPEAVALAETLIAPQPQTPAVAPLQRPREIVEAALKPLDKILRPAPERRVITRSTTSGGRHWGITLGRYRTRNAAERLLLQTALQEIETLDEALRKVVNHPRGWEANFVGLSRDKAELACARLSARGVDCKTRGPGA